jgi:hypothetical protein
MRQTPQQHALGFELIDLRRSGMTRKPRQVEGAARVGMTLASAISRIRAIATLERNPGRLGNLRTKGRRG